MVSVEKMSVLLEVDDILVHSLSFKPVIFAALTTPTHLVGTDLSKLGWMIEKKKKNQTNKGTYNDVKRRPEYIENTQGNKSNSCYRDKQQHNIEDFIQLPVKAQVGFFFKQKS